MGKKKGKQQSNKGEAQEGSSGQPKGPQQNQGQGQPGHQGGQRGQEGQGQPPHTDSHQKQEGQPTPRGQSETPQSALPQKSAWGGRKAVSLTQSGKQDVSQPSQKPHQEKLERATEVDPQPQKTQSALSQKSTWGGRPAVLFPQDAKPEDIGQPEGQPVQSVPKQGQVKQPKTKGLQPQESQSVLQRSTWGGRQGGSSTQPGPSANQSPAIQKDPHPELPGQPPQEGHQPQAAQSDPPKKSAWGGQQKAVSTPPAASTSVPKRQAKDAPRSQNQGDLMPVLPTKSVAKKRHEVPHRKGSGTSGRKTMVEVNQIALDFSKLCPVIYHYDVAIEPDQPKRFLREVIQKFIRRHFPNVNPAFDGKKNLYTAKPLTLNEKLRTENTIEVTNFERVSNREIEFRVAIKLAQKIDTSPVLKYVETRRTRIRMDVPQSAIQAIDVVLRTAPLQEHIVPVGRSFYIPPENLEKVVKLGGGLELWYGFYQSAILNWKPFLNVDVAHKGFPEPKLLTYILQEVCDVSDLNQPPTSAQVHRFKNFVATLKCDYELPNNPTSKRTYRINGIGPSAVELRFKPDDGPEVSVVEYFRKTKNHNIRYPHLPTVQVDPVAKNIFLPLELCRLKKGQPLNRKLDDRQTLHMVKAAAQPPAIRKDKILAAIRSARYNQNPAVKEFGIKINENMEKVEARVLTSPTVQYKDTTQITPRSGVWRAGRLLESRRLSKWFILNLDYGTRRESLDGFSSLFVRQAKDLGMAVQNVTSVESLNVRSGRIKTDIINCLNKWKSNEAELVVVILPKFGADFYGLVKQCAELEVGVLTQCIKAETMLQRMNPSTCGNILLKVNSKTNGTNHQLGDVDRPRILERPVMFVGIDVTHPSPDQKNIPSVAAVAASHDARAAFRYNMIWRLQNPKDEIVRDLKNIIIQQLLFFYERSGYKPEKIIVYRDGVGEGMFQQVLDGELTAIRDACLSMPGQNYKPGITFLIVQKRHHVRFFPTRKEDEDGKNKNVPPGLIVDTQIIHPTEMDFYLVSHASLQGTSRPTKYHRLWDDNNFSEDELERWTYYLCYLFARCTRSVSYPAPTYYAHLAAFRVRHYLENNPPPLNDLQRYAERHQIKEDFVKKSPMFFV